jgi:hypothetical protein
MKNLKPIDVVKVVGATIGIISVVKAFREADHRSDKLEMTEALLRGATLTISVILLVRHLRQEVAEADGPDLAGVLGSEAAALGDA